MSSLTRRLGCSVRLHRTAGARERMRRQTGQHCCDAINLTKERQLNESCQPIDRGILPKH